MDSWKASFLRAGVYPERVGVSYSRARRKSKVFCSSGASFKEAWHPQREVKQAKAALTNPLSSDVLWAINAQHKGLCLTTKWYVSVEPRHRCFSVLFTAQHCKELPAVL